MRKFFLPSLLVSFTSFAFAATDSSWLTAQTNSPLYQKRPISISFNPDKVSCQKAYGDKWLELCRETLRQAGSSLSEEELPFKKDGVWVWTTPTTLQFTPKENWKPEEKITLNFSSLSLPNGVNLSSSKVELTTAPLATLNSSSQFWSDNFADSDKVATFEFDFSYPVDKAQIEKSFSLVATGKNELPKFSNPQFIWDESATHLLVKLKVLELTKNSTEVRATLSSIKGNLKYELGQYSFSEKASQTLNIPGKDSLFEVNHTAIVSEVNTNLESENIAEVGFSLAINPIEAAKHIKVYALPEKLNEKSIVPTDWANLPHISKDTLSKAKLIPFTVLDSEDETRTLRLNLGKTQNRFFALVVDNSLISSGKTNFKLKKEFISVLESSDNYPSVSFIQPGNFVSLAGAKDINVVTSNVDKLKWKVSQVKPEFVSHVLSNSSIYAGSVSSDFIESKSGTITLENTGNNEFSKINVVSKNSSGLYLVELTGIKKENGKEKEVTQNSKLILASNVGLWAKKNKDNSYSIFAASILDGKPISASVEVFGANGNLIWSGKTDELGSAKTEKLNSTQELSPSLIKLVATTGDIGLLSLKDSSNISNYFRFDTSGVSDIQGVNYTDRGTYRPGETAHLISLLKDKAPNAPLFAKVYDPTRKLIFTKKLDLSSSIASADFVLSEDLPFGTYSFHLSAGKDDEAPVLASTTFKVEEFLDDTMKLVASSKKGWFVGSGSIDTQVTNLTGATSKKKVGASIYAYPASFWTFSEIPGFNFALPTSLGRTNSTIEVDAVDTDNSGKAKVGFKFDQTAGALQGTILVSAFDEIGANAVKENVKFKAAPFNEIIGYKITSTDDELLTKDETVKCEILVVDSDLKPIKDKTVTVSFGKKVYFTELASDEKGRPYYREKATNKLLDTITVTTDSEGKASFNLLTKEAGSMSAEFKLDNFTSGFSYQVTGLTTSDRFDSGLVTASLKVSAPKKVSGKNVTVGVLSPFDAKALVTWETDKVLDFAWVELKKGENELTLKTPQALGKVYLNIGAMRSIKDADKFIEPYAESVTPIILNENEAKTKVTISAPKEVKENSFTFKVLSDKPTKLALWAVDSGILTATNYKSPNPFDKLYASNALTVQTRQMLSNLMPENIWLPQKKTSTGGDYAEKDMALKATNAALSQLNPYKASFEKPAIWWGGVVEVKGENSFTATLPKEFQGSLKLFALGLDESSKLISQSENVTVRAPLFASVSLPREVLVGDKFDALILVTSKENTKPFTLNLDGLGVDKTINAKTSNSTYSEVLNLAALTPGLFDLKLSVDSQPITYKVAVNPTNEKSSSVTLLKANSTTPFNFTKNYLDFNYSSSIEVSSVPIPLVRTAIDIATSNAHSLSRLIAQTEVYTYLLTHESAMDTLGLKASDIRKKANDAYKALLTSIDKEFYSIGTLEAAKALNALINRSEISALQTQVAEKLKKKLDAALRRSISTIDEARTNAYAIWVLTRWGEFPLEKAETLIEDFNRIFKSKDAFNYMINAVYVAAKLESKLEGSPKIKRSQNWSELSLLTTLKLMGNDVTGLNDKVSECINLGVLTPEDAANFVLASNLTQAKTPNVTLACSKWANSATDIKAQSNPSSLIFNTTGCLSGTLDIKSDTFVALKESGYSLTKDAISKGLVVSTRILDALGNEVTKLKAGQTYSYEITILSGEENLGSNALEVAGKLPSGVTWEESHKPLGVINLQKTLTSFSFTAKPITRTNTQTFKFKVRAMNTGSFVAPQVKANVVGAPNIFGTSKEGRITIQ